MRNYDLFAKLITHIALLYSHIATFLTINGINGFEERESSIRDLLSWEQDFFLLGFI